MFRKLFSLCLSTAIIACTHTARAQCTATVTASGSTSFCSNNTGPTLSSSVSPGPSIAVHWQVSPNGASWTNIAGANSSTYSPTASGYYRSLDSNSGCGAYSNSIQVVVVTQPPAPTAIPVTYCQYATASPLSALGNNLLWYISATGGAAMTSSPVPLTTVPGVQTFYVSQSIGGCESPRAALPVTIIPQPVVTMTASTFSVCAGDTIHLGATTNGGSPAFSWSGPNGFTSTNTFPVIPNAAPAMAGTYHVIAVVNGCVSQMDSTVVTITCLDSVWAGDVNYDHIVDNTDALEIALNYGSAGVPRAGASISWVSQFGANWASSLVSYSAVNSKHADCDGNGLVDYSDTLAVTANYGLTHPRGVHTTSTKMAGIPDLYFDFTGITLSPGSVVSVPIRLGSATVPMNKITGLAARIMFAANPLSSPAQIDYSGGCLGLGSNSLHFTKAVNSDRVDIACARTDHHSANGYGKLATVTFTVPVAASGKMLLYFDDVTIVDSAGNKITAFNTPEDSVSIFPTSVGSLYHDAPIVNIVPNPSTSHCALNLTLSKAAIYSITITDVTGRIVWTTLRNAQNGPESIQLPAAQLCAGAYLVHLTSDQWPTVTAKWLKQE